MEFPVYIHKTSFDLLLSNICRVTTETGTRLKEMLAFKESSKNVKLGAGFLRFPWFLFCVMGFICSELSPIHHARPSEPSKQTPQLLLPFISGK
jgi:hypothetical protein